MGQYAERRSAIQPIPEYFKRPQYIGWGEDQSGTLKEFYAHVLGTRPGLSSDGKPDVNRQRYYMRPGVNPKLEPFGVKVTGDTGPEVCIETKRLGLDVPRTYETHDGFHNKTHLLWNEVVIVQPEHNSVWMEILEGEVHRTTTG